MDRKCPKKNCKSNVYKHFNPNCERNISPCLPTILPINDDEVKRSFRQGMMSNKKSTTIQQKKSKQNTKSVTDTDLMKKKKIDVKLPLSSTKRSVTTNALNSKTDTCTSHSATNLRISSSINIRQSPCTIDDNASRISYNIQCINRQSNCRISLEDEPPSKKEGTVKKNEPIKNIDTANLQICESATQLILDRIDNCKLTNTITCKYVESLKNEIKQFSSPKCSKYTEDLENIKQEISSFRKSKDEKYNEFYKKLEMLNLPPCLQSKNNVQGKKRTFTQDSIQTKIPKEKTLPRSKFFLCAFNDKITSHRVR